MAILNISKISGKTISLRFVVVSNAENILQLRLDKSKNKYIHKVENDIEKQRQWITEQLQRDGDYYFGIFDSNEDFIGTISIYNVMENCAELGRWISNGNAIQNLESLILAYDFAFETLCLESVYLRTVKDNEKVISFHRKFGAFIVGDVTDGEFIMEKAVITKSQYPELKNRHMNLINTITKGI